MFKKKKIKYFFDNNKNLNKKSSFSPEIQITVSFGGRVSFNQVRCEKVFQEMSVLGFPQQTKKDVFKKRRKEDLKASFMFSAKKLTSFACVVKKSTKEMKF
jgi:hypothetical protein